jgi:hypothetical protein
MIKLQGLGSITEKTAGNIPSTRFDRESEGAFSEAE